MFLSIFPQNISLEVQEIRFVNIVIYYKMYLRYYTNSFSYDSTRKWNLKCQDIRTVWTIIFNTFGTILYSTSMKQVLFRERSLCLMYKIHMDYITFRLITWLGLFHWVKVRIIKQLALIKNTKEKFLEYISMEVQCEMGKF